MDKSFVAENASGLPQLADALQEYTLENIAKGAGIPESDLRRAAQRLFMIPLENLYPRDTVGRD